MIPPSLPSYLAEALDAKLEGLSRTDAARRSDTISQTYRAGGNSGRISTAEDALAYAVARMPATYAAIAASLNALLDVRPDFAPRSLIDCGAGPGTATWAAREAFSSLDNTMLFDANAALRNLALGLAAPDDDLRYVLGDAVNEIAKSAGADLVIASYLINELSEAARAELTDALWQATRDTLLVVEPGTPAGYVRILELRARLIAQGAHVVAPCPHDSACPLTAPDWCHFSQRLPRSRAHKHLKGADLPYEDEKFSYVILSRAAIDRPAARVLAKPDVTKISVTTKLCTPSGLAFDTASRRDKAAYSAAKKRDWGDAVLSAEES